MEEEKEIEIQEMSLSHQPQTIGSLQVTNSNGGFGHNMDFISQPYQRNRYSEIDIEDESCNGINGCPLPIYLKVHIST